MIQLIQNLFFSKTVTFQQTKKNIVNTLEGRTSNPEPFGGHLPNQAQDSSFTFIILSLMPHSGFFYLVLWFWEEAGSLLHCIIFLHLAQSGWKMLQWQWEERNGALTWANTGADTACNGRGFYTKSHLRRLWWGKETPSDSWKWEQQVSVKGTYVACGRKGREGGPAPEIQMISRLKTWFDGSR